MAILTVGIDAAKNVSAAHGVDVAESVARTASPGLVRYAAEIAWQLPKQIGVNGPQH